METTGTISRYKVHHGKNVKRFRELFGMKQEVLAEEIGLSQQTISRLESQEELDEAVLEKIAIALKIPVEAIKNFSEEAAFNIISNTFSSYDTSTLHGVNYYPTFNPIEKVIELYERMIKEKNDLLEKLLKEK